MSKGQLHGRVAYIRFTETGKFEARVTQGDGRFITLGTYTTRQEADQAIEAQWDD